jgi:dihydroorotate dehydrogenase electron transfer subunit
LTKQRSLIVQKVVPVVDRREVVQGIFVVTLQSREIATSSLPGQFLNVRCGEGCLPLLRRPFSISRIDGDNIELMFNVIGQGTRMLSAKRPGDSLDVLGPLGRPFGIGGEYETAVLVAGGLGVAPFPFLTDFLARSNKKILTFLGARTSSQLTEHFLRNVEVATDDGSRGFAGTVVDLLRGSLSSGPVASAKIFGCGPTKMLQSLAQLADKSAIDCELSLEGDMACGMGICQGCPVERSDGKRKYALVCTDGPTFNSKDIILR